MSLGMFCAIPLPRRQWDDSCLDLVLCFFPVVGLLLGLIWLGIAWLLVLSGIHVMPAAAALAVAPFLLTGFLHLDGYMDTGDALLSRRPLEEKLRILKDPHAGAFAVAIVATLFILQFAAVYAALDAGSGFASVVFIAVISRCCASLSILCLKVMPQSGYGNLFRINTGASHKTFVGVLMAVALGASYIFAGLTGLAASLSAAAGFTCAMAYAYKEFEGVSGDLTGFALTVGELCGLLALAALGGR